jgi:hypothetical protein
MNILNLWNIILKLGIALQLLTYKQYFMIVSVTNIYIPDFNNLLSTSIKTAAKENFRKAILFYIRQKYLNKVAYFSEPCCRTLFQDLKTKWH